MKRISLLAVLAAAVLLGLSVAPQSASADPRFGYPAGYTLVSDLNAVGLATQCNAPPQGTAAVNVYGTFVGSLDVYTSVTGKFDDAVKQGALITAPTASTLSITLPVGTTAVRVQNRAYTSGDPFVGLDCFGGVIVNPVAVPTPTATP